MSLSQIVNFLVTHDTRSFPHPPKQVKALITMNNLDISSVVVVHFLRSSQILKIYLSIFLCARITCKSTIYDRQRSCDDVIFISHRDRDNHGPKNFITPYVSIMQLGEFRRYTLCFQIRNYTQLKIAVYA